MNRRHLVLSDLHENSEALKRFIQIAEARPGGFDDIWLLGDVFGHSVEATGAYDLTRPVLDDLMSLMRYDGYAVQGNWEYWLSHPERDPNNKDQGKYSEQLIQRRELLAGYNGRPLLDRLTRDSVLIHSENGTPEFTLFHGCSYPCHRNSDYQPEPCECYLFPRDLNIVTRGLFGDPGHLASPHFLFGHTHIPGYFTYSVTGMVNMWQFYTDQLKDTPVSYGDEALRFGINPGSAGIAEKNHPRTALLLDTGEKTFTYLTDEER